MFAIEIVMREFAHRPSREFIVPALAKREDDFAGWGARTSQNESHFANFRFILQRTGFISEFKLTRAF
jgi:hypothetical protein